MLRISNAILSIVLLFGVTTTCRTQSVDSLLVFRHAPMTVDTSIGYSHISTASVISIPWRSTMLVRPGDVQSPRSKRCAVRGAIVGLAVGVAVVLFLPCDEVCRTSDSGAPAGFRGSPWQLGSVRSRALESVRSWTPHTRSEWLRGNRPAFCRGPVEYPMPASTTVPATSRRLRS